MKAITPVTVPSTSLPTSNPMTGMQAFQQTPGGISPQLAQYFQQQQAQTAAEPSQSTLADLIQKLQDSGSPEESQQLIQQIQQNGGQQLTDQTQGIFNGAVPAPTATAQNMPNYYGMPASQ